MMGGPGGKGKNGIFSFGVEVKNLHLPRSQVEICVRRRTKRKIEKMGSSIVAGPFRREAKGWTGSLLFLGCLRASQKGGEPSNPSVGAGD